MSLLSPRAWTLARRASVLVSLGWLGVVVALAVLFAVTGRNQAAVVDLLERVGPARRGAASLLTTLVEEQNAVRGYALTGDPARQATYEAVSDHAGRQVAELRPLLLTSDPDAIGYLNQLLADLTTWRNEGANPLLAAVAKGGARPAADSTYLAEELRFGDVLNSARVLIAQLEAQRDVATLRLENSRDIELITLTSAGVMAAIAGVLTILLVRRWVTSPIERLAADARRVANGDHEHRLAEPPGPPELVRVAADVERMRSRIVNELAQLAASQDQLRATQRELEQQALDLVRSNRDLEQFAYVASHDLQEPLRKVAGFCQLLQRRYSGQLDERAEQYIEFAVDGAQRMQQLISELLQFSRVGRSERQLSDVLLADVAVDALAELEPARLAASVGGDQAEVTMGTLPVVHGDPVLLRQLLANLIGNALKFHRPDEAASVRVDATPDPSGWLVTVADNGIGIDPKFAEKIFVLFQRLHAKQTYPGTGIGLALAKRIVEYHGGRIWLDTEREDGTTIRFTLPAANTETALPPRSGEPAP
ncbi:MAG TPA: ATP-binding protein [Pseudonocardia sp.]